MKDITECTHGVQFNAEAYKTSCMSSSQVRSFFPRFDGKCPDCGFHGIAYASMEHMMAGDW